MEADCVVVLDASAPANLIWRIGRHTSISERRGVPRAETYPACARFKFGDGRLEEVRYAAGIPAGIAGGPEKFAAFALGAEIPS